MQNVLFDPRRVIQISSMASNPITIRWIRTDLSQTENHVYHRITDNSLRISNKNHTINTSFLGDKYILLHVYLIKQYYLCSIFLVTVLL